MIGDYVSLYVVNQKRFYQAHIMIETGFSYAISGLGIFEGSTYAIIRHRQTDRQIYRHADRKKAGSVLYHIQNV